MSVHISHTNTYTLEIYVPSHAYIHTWQVRASICSESNSLGMNRVHCLFAKCMCMLPSEFAPNVCTEIDMSNR